jgi:hypothetical protein
VSTQAVFLTISMTFTFWEVHESDGNQWFLLTPPAMLDDVPTRLPATPKWSVEAPTIQEAQDQLLGHMGWGPMTQFEGQAEPESAEVRHRSGELIQLARRCAVLPDVLPDVLPTLIVVLGD